VAGEQAPPPAYSVADRYGPLVHRSVHHGALLIIIGALQFLAAMVVTQIGYGSSYSLRDNYISDLGAAYCGTFSGTGAFGSGSHYACSPWHVLFNVSIVLMGLLLVLGAILLRTAFPVRRSRTIGLALLVLTGIGSIGVGLSPEDVNITVHVVSALLAFVGGAFALIVLGFAMFRDTRWDGFRAYSILSGLVSFVALILFASKAYLDLGPGGMERLIVAPLLLWTLVVGVHLVQIPTFAPRTISKADAG